MVLVRLSVEYKVYVKSLAEFMSQARDNVIYWRWDAPVIVKNWLQVIYLKYLKFREPL
ncbi:hypothetical protein NIES19_19560 [Anabaena cylindrica PCC 7122]|nr:hypothetical protein NIES19_19560 [Anabaena cylindrica PCC 7122]